MAKSRSVAARVEAVRELAKQPEESAERRSGLLQALADKSNLVIAAAATALSSNPVDKIIAPLMERYWWLAEDGVKRDSGCVARSAILQALVKCRAVEAVAVFRHAIATYQPEKTGLGMDDTAVALRSQAAAAMAELRLPGALLALSLLLFDYEPRVPYAPQERLYVNMAARIAAARCLAALGEPGAVAVLGVKLSQREQEIPEVLVECMDAIAALDPEAALQMLLPCLSHASAHLAVGAATALAGLPEPWHNRVIEMLAAACANAGAAAREPLALALASMRNDAVVPALAALADHRSVETRLAAVSALAQRADAAALAVLRELAKRKGDAAVSSMARRSLQALS